MEPRYEHGEAEKKTYKLWEESGYFDPDKLPGDRPEPFTIIMPPPNANGSLHAGHALFITLEDVITRYQRMRGKKALWVPGADHAGFETQIVYEKKLEKEGRSRMTMERADLYKEIMAFTLENKSSMEDQVRSLGASCDWSREKFTLDPGVVEEVQRTFVRMYKDGFIYRGKRPVNWCTKHQTSLSDVETESKEADDTLYYLKYGPLLAATVRPETIFGDVALAVNPTDVRYKQYIGKDIEFESLLGPVKLPVVGDDTVDAAFGTGVVKITPAHDANDFATGQRHNLPTIEVIDKFGKLNEKTGKYAGMKVADARKVVAEDLAAKGLIEKTEPYKHTIPTCYKCNTTIEPRIMDQWFVTMKPLADKAAAAVREKKITFIPERFEKTFLYWMDNTIDWNISRQIAWGIQIPAWYKTPEPKWDLKLYGERTLEYIQSGRKRFETRAGKPEGAEKDWRAMGAEDIIRFTAVDPGNEKPLDAEPATKKIVGTRHFNSVTEMLAAIPLSAIAPGVTAEEYTATMLSYPGSPERLEKYGVWAIELAEIERTEARVEMEKPDGEGWLQDPDVFDTWFSSGQWPLLALDYPSGADFKEFYPTQVMETGYDLIFKWIPRMVIFGLYLNDRVPFTTVYLHGLVLDPHGKKMSKSKGNVMNPLELTEKYGTDALRMALVVGNPAGSDLALSEDKIRGYRNFATKIWNAARFVLTNKPAGIITGEILSPELAGREEIKTFDAMKAEVAKHIDDFEFHLAAEKAYHYVWHTFADIVIESEKKNLHDGTDEEKKNAYLLLEHLLLGSLTILHPLMPFVTEEIYQIFRPGKMLMVEKW